MILISLKSLIKECLAGLNGVCGEAISSQYPCWGKFVSKGLELTWFSFQRLKPKSTHSSSKAKMDFIYISKTLTVKFKFNISTTYM